MSAVFRWAFQRRLRAIPPGTPSPEFAAVARVLAQNPWRRPVTWWMLRAVSEGLNAICPPLPGTRREPVRLRGSDAPAELVRVGDRPPERTVLYLHGGAYVAGSLHSHRGFVSRVAARLRADVLHVGYRLAPQQPMPGAVADAVAAHAWLRERVPAERLLLAGDSAGGGLALLALQAGCDAAGAALLSPWTDLSMAQPSFTTNRGRDAALPAEALVSADALGVLAPGVKATDPRVSPLYGDFRGLPPLLFLAGEAELVRDDSVAAHAAAVDAGVDAHIHVEPRMCHVYPLFMDVVPEAQAAMGRMAAFAERVAPP